MTKFPVQAVCLLTIVSTVSAGAQATPKRAPVPAPFAAITREVAKEMSGDRALKTVSFVEQFFRLPGNRGFDASIDTVAGLLAKAGYVLESNAKATDRLVYRVESRPMKESAWTPDDASLTIVGRAKPLQLWATNHNMLAINSYATAAGGVTATVIDVGAGTDADFDKNDVKGKIAFIDGNFRAAFTKAMQRGAVGVLATQKLPAYNQQSINVSAIQFTSVPRDSVHQGWLIFVSSAARDSLRAALAKAALAKGTVQVNAMVKARFENRPERTVVAEVRGATVPAERFVYSAHVQEPGANDNATGVGLLAEIARVAALMVKSGRANPARTMTFLWGDEIRSTARFLSEDTTRRAGVKWGMSLDMVGENTAKTGGTFLIEKMPDPSAVWVRGEDQHTEWGGRPLTVSEIRPYWFNDFVRARCLDRAASTGWVVKANPFEGGSDHTPFLTAKIPAVLLWHFTDQFYHTDLDRIEMVSATTLGNVGNCALNIGLVLATGSRDMTVAALDELTRVAESTLRTQGALSRDTLTRGGRAETERLIIDTWRDYYMGAVDHITDIAAAPISLEAELTAARDRVKRAAAAARP